MDGIQKVQVLSTPRSGFVSWAGESLPVPGGRTVVAKLRGLWLEKIQAKGRTSEAEIDEAVKAILDLACTHLGVQQEQRDGVTKLTRATVETIYISERTGEEVQIKRDPLTQEAVVVGETPLDDEPGGEQDPEAFVDQERWEAEEPGPFDEADAQAASAEAEELASQEKARAAAKKKAQAAKKKK